MAVPIPRVTVNPQIQLLCGFLPGDMDKISYPPGREDFVAQDAIAAHRLLEWFLAFQDLVNEGIEAVTPEELNAWKRNAAEMFMKSKELM